MTEPTNLNPDGSLIDLARGKNAHVSNTVYLHSEEMNMLVKELRENWADDPHYGKRTMWWYSLLLIAQPDAFIEIFNLEFGTRLQFDSLKEKELCWEMLNVLRKARGVHIFGRS